MHELASVLSYKIGRLPFIYLAFLLAAMRHLIFWEPIIDRIKARLFEWKSRNLSFGGRLILLKSVLPTPFLFSELQHVYSPLLSLF